MNQFFSIATIILMAASITSISTPAQAFDWNEIWGAVKDGVKQPSATPPVQPPSSSTNPAPPVSTSPSPSPSPSSNPNPSPSPIPNGLEPPSQPAPVNTQNTPNSAG